MELELEYRKAKFNDLTAIVELLAEDFLGKTRERFSQELDHRYSNAFNLIDSDPNQFLMVVTHKNIVIATCHLTIIPSLTYQGAKRLQIEAVRVSRQYRSTGIGKWMMDRATEYAKNNKVKIIQLTTNKQRSGSIDFYMSCGFETTHVGMKKHL